MLPDIDKQSGLKTISQNTFYQSTNNFSITGNFPSNYSKINNLRKVKKANSSNQTRNNQLLIKNYIRKNYSSFNDNIYDYPQYKNNFSFFTNISNEVTDLYCDFNFLKAPTLKQNLSQIRKIMQSNKHEKLNYLNNLYCNSLFHNNKANTFYNDNTKNNSRNKIIDINNRNNSCCQLVSNTKKILKGDNNNNNANDLKKNFKITSSIGNLNSTTYKSNCSDNNHIFNTKDSCINKKNDIIMKKLSQSQKNFFPRLNSEKLLFKINEAMFENSDKIQKLNEFEIKILQMKIYQEFQSEGLNSFLKNKVYSVYDNLNYVENLYKKFKTISIDYNFSIQSYIKFLTETYTKEENELIKLDNDKRQVEIDIDNEINKIIKTQKNLEALIEMRNFLFRVKNKNNEIKENLNFYKNATNKKYRKKTAYLQLQEKIGIESKKYVVADFFIRLFGLHSNLYAYKYLCYCYPRLNKRGSSLLNNIKKTIFNLQKKNNFNNEFQLNLKVPKKGEKIFETVDDFIDTMNYLENKILSLLKQRQIIRQELRLLKKKYEVFNPLDEKKYNEYILDEISRKNNELTKIKNRYNFLKSKYDLLDNKSNIFNSNKNITTFENCNENNSLKKEELISLNYYFKRKYNKLIAEAKTPWIIFLKKLIENYNKFILSNYSDNENIYTIIEPELFEKIKKYVNQDSEEIEQKIIIKYTLKMMKLFEYICQRVLRKSEELKNGVNREMVRKKNDEIQYKKKIKNNKIIRKLIKEERFKNCQKLYKKWSKYNYYITRKMPIKIQNKKLRNKSLDNIFIKKQNEAEKDNFSDDINITEEE